MLPTTLVCLELPYLSSIPPLSLSKGLAILVAALWKRCPPSFRSALPHAGHTGDVLVWVRMDLTSLLQYAGNALQTNML